MSNEIDGLDAVYAARLYKMLSRYFDEQELRSLMFELGVEYDNLPGVGVIGKARELVAYMNRRNRLNDLIMAAYKERPQIPWPHPPQTPPIEEYKPQGKGITKNVKNGLILIGGIGIIILLIVGVSVIFKSVQGIMNVTNFPEPNLVIPQESVGATVANSGNSLDKDELNSSNNSSTLELKSLNVPTDKLLVFVRGSEHDNSEIFTIRLDDNKLTQLTNTVGQNWAPAWSKDGQWIAFTSDRDGNNEIYVMDADGEKQVRITQTSYNEWFPSWSPDGRSLVYYSDRNGNREIYTLDLETEEIKRLTDNLADDVYPSWSPDGSQIAFTSERDGFATIYVVNVDGSNLRRLTNSAVESWFPSWSPDGSLIAFHSNISGNFQIYTIKPDGTGLIRLTVNQANDYDASWSSDGNWIVFNSDRDDLNKNDALDEREIYIVRSNGNNQVRLTFNNSTVEKWVEWQP